MDPELVLSPAGNIYVGGPADEETDAWLRKASGAFARGRAPGLFALAAAHPDVPPPPSVAFWRDFACRYMHELCLEPEAGGRPVDPPAPLELADFLLAAPPMQGAEYLSAGVLQELWRDLDGWVREEMRSLGEGLGGFLARRAPAWHQVGRVCFHLAENKRDRECPFAFLATYAPGLSRSGRVRYRPLSAALKEYAGARNKRALIQLLSPVHRASEKSAFVKELVDSGDIFHPLAWTPAEAYRFLGDAPLLEESGVLVRLPDWWRARPRPRVAVRIGESRRTGLGKKALLDFRVDLVLGDEKVTEAEWKALMEAGDGLVYLKGQWVEVDRERLAQALAHWRRVEKEAAGGGITFAEGMRLLAGAPADLAPVAAEEERDREWAFVNAGAWLGDMLAGLRDPARLKAAAPGRELKATLRNYQKTGLRWLWFLSNLGLGACLADDMGLGKTLQVLALLLVERKSRRKPSLVVVPASLLANWKAEIERFTPSLAAAFLHPSEMDRTEIDEHAADPSRAFAGLDAVLTTYGMLVRQPWLLDVDWRLAILDEAQAIKNAETRQARAVKRLRCEARIALTGTPVENRLSDLWSLFDFLCPGLLGSASRFKAFARSLEAGRRGSYAPLRALVQPYILRRLKTDKRIIADLPEKTEVKAYCGLRKEQAVLYAKSVAELAEALEGIDGMRRRGVVLSYLLRFKQICNHPSQLTGDGAYRSEHSGKFERLRDLCEEIASRQEKALVFTQFREIIDPLAALLARAFGREGLSLHGGTPVGKRRKLIEAFQQEHGPPFFLVSLKAGGTGLNLTAATHVIHFDRWWNPAVEDQATDRAYRIGQRRNVLVHKFVCRGTVEERIDALIEEKRLLAEDLIEGGAEAVLTEMGTEELLGFVSLDIEKARV